MDKHFAEVMTPIGGTVYEGATIQDLWATCGRPPTGPVVILEYGTGKILGIVSGDVLNGPSDTEHVPVVHLMNTSFQIVNDSQLFPPLSLQPPPYVVIDRNSVPVGIVTMDNPCWFELIKNLKDRVWELEAAVEMIHDGIGICDGEGRVLYVNSSFQRISGLTKSEAGVGRLLSELVSENLMSHAVALKVLESGLPETITQTYRTGREVLASGTPLKRNNRIERVVVNFRDITELNQLRAECDEARRLTLKYREELDLVRKRELNSNPIVAESAAMKRVMEVASKVADTDMTVLLTGESGVGKEVVATFIHNVSTRSSGPFIQVNCGAIPESLLESELFGHEKGAFTGARREGKPGLFEIADRGTLLLDEIGEMPLPLQVKLLRVIEKKSVTRVGGTKPREFDVRLIAATNSDLKQKVHHGTFRQDLYYRLNVVEIRVPPLRERKEDIVPLAVHFLLRLNERYKKNKRIDARLLAKLEQYDWPGNVRELENTIKRLFALSDKEIITFDNNLLPTAIVETQENIPVLVKNLLPLKEAEQLLYSQLIRRALSEHRTIRRAALALRVPPSTLFRKMKKLVPGHGLQPSKKQLPTLEFPSLDCPVKTIDNSKSEQKDA